MHKVWPIRVATSSYHIETADILWWPKILGVWAKDVRNWLISIGFLILVAKIFEIFGFDAGFEGPQPHSKFSILISNRNLLLQNFWLRFRNIIWNYQHFRTYLSNGKQEIWGMWRHCHLIRIFKNIILVVVLVLNIAAQAYWFWFWFRICSK